MHDAIRDWLNSSRNYAAGVSLYLKYGIDSRLLNCFKEPIESEFKKKLLLEELTRLYHSHPLFTGEDPPKEEEPAEKHWPEAVADTPLSTLREEWRPLYGTLTNLQARIHDVAYAGLHDALKKEEAYQMAAEIVRLTNKINEIYYAKDYYLKHGKLPSTDPEPVATLLSNEDAYTKKKNIERYLRDLAKKLKRENISEIKRVKWLPKWDTLCKEITALNKQLNRPENEGIPER